MHHPKDFFLSALGIPESSEHFPYDVAVQRNNEEIPFCIIKTTSTGNTFLRVNSWDDDDKGMVYFIK